MQDRHKKRDKEYCQNLAVNRSFDFFLTHSYFLHNLIPVFVIIAFRNLFVINDQAVAIRNKNPTKIPRKKNPP